MTEKRLLLVDLENIHKIDLSRLDDSYRAIIYVGAKQNPPRSVTQAATAHRFERVEIQRIEGGGKNALDFHIACQLGRTFETARRTECIVLSKDKGFDPLLLYMNKNGLVCRRVESMEDLIGDVAARAGIDAGAQTVCPRCHKAKTIEHHGGRWCSNCGDFATPPDPALLPSNQIEYQERDFFAKQRRLEVGQRSDAVCGWCSQPKDMSSGIYDDGEWMCGDCVAEHVT